MKRKIFLSAALAAFGATPAAAQTVAIEGGTVHTMTGAPIEGGTVLLRDGQVVAVGRDVAVPAGARRIDARGKIVTPGLFESGTNIGLIEIEGIVETNDFTPGEEEGDLFSAAFNVADGLNPNSMLIPITRVAGITTAMSRPQGGVIAGQGVVIDLLGRDMDAMMVRNPAAMFANLGQAARQFTKGARGGTTLLLREVLADAQAYARNRAAYERGATREFSASRGDLEALQPVLAGRVPLVVEAHRASDILTALRLAEEYDDLRLIVYGGTEAWMVAEELAQARVPVILKVLANLPRSFETLGATYENAARLRRAGVPIALTTGESFKAYNLRQEAGNAVAYGLPYDEALRAVTLYPAQIWGLDDRYGSLAPGKVANVVVWDGDPLELTTPVEHVFIRGREVPLTSRETELRDRYLQINDQTRAYRQPGQ